MSLRVSHLPSSTLFGQSSPRPSGQVPWRCYRLIYAPRLGQVGSGKLVIAGLTFLGIKRKTRATNKSNCSACPTLHLPEAPWALWLSSSHTGLNGVGVRTQPWTRSSLVPGDIPIPWDPYWSGLHSLNQKWPDISNVLVLVFSTRDAKLNQTGSLPPKTL